MLKRIIAQIPNSITCLNLLSGCLACIFTFSCDESIGALKGYEWAFICIGAAAIFDFCDGAAARLLHLYSLIGKELDSLADLISFGLAPALLMFNTMNAHNESSMISYVALTIAVFGALRLAKFNVDELQTTSFRGLPIPANAIFWIGTCSWINTHGYMGDAVTVGLIVVISLLMVSNIRMFSLKFKNFKLIENLKRYVILLSAILLVVFFAIPGFALAICLYLLMSIVFRERAE